MKRPEEQWEIIEKEAKEGNKQAQRELKQEDKSKQ